MTEIDPFEAYRQAGVDLGASNAASQIASDAAQDTWANRAGLYGEPQSYSNEFISAKRLSLHEIRKREDVYEVDAVDGIGTKGEFAERTRKFHGLGFDLMAMMIDDLPVEGAEAVLVNNGLSVSRLDEETLPYIYDLFEGFKDAANMSDVVIYTGEIAVHGDRLQGPTDFTVDWMGSARGLVTDKRTLTGEDVQEGDILIGFREPDGFRCNGISLARKTFLREYKDNWHNESFEGTTLGTLASSPSTLYSGLMKVLTGGYRSERLPLVDIHGAAHISGGSMPEKIGRMLRATGLGALVDTPFEMPSIMRHCQELARVELDNGNTRPMSDEEMISTWHGGTGYVVATPEAHVDLVIATASIKGVEADVVGKITKEPGIKILSHGVATPGKLMSFS